MMESGAEQAYEKYADELVQFCSVLVGPSCADDITADAMLRVFLLPDWQQIVELRAYLYRAVLNEARSQHRSTQRRLHREVRYGTRPGSVPAATVRVEVLDALRRLSVRQRAVVYLTYWCDLYVEEIATDLAISPRTVARDLARARKLLEVLLT